MTDASPLGASGEPHAEPRHVSRSLAIAELLRVFIATKNAQDPSSAPALVAAVLFDAAVHALRPEEGLTREQLAAKVDALAEQHGMPPRDLDQALDRFRKSLAEFSTLLPLCGVQRIAGPTRNQRKDNIQLLWLEVEFVEDRPAPAAGKPDDVLVEETSSLLAATIKQILSQRFSRERLLEIRDHLNRGNIVKALAILLFISGCAWAIRYFLMPNAIPLTAAGQTIRLDKHGHIVAGHWMTWHSLEQPLSAFHVLRDGTEITPRVRLFQKTFRDGVNYGFEDTGVDPAQPYTYQIARRLTFGRRALSRPFRACSKCLVQKLAIAQTAHARHERVVESGPESDLASAQYSLGGVMVEHVGQPASFHVSISPDRFFEKNVSPITIASLPDDAWLECDFSDGPVELWPEQAIQHTWTRPGRYLLRTRRRDEATAQHTTMHVSIITVLDAPSVGDRTYQYDFVAHDRAELPAAFADEILRTRLIRAPARQPLHLYFDLTTTSLWRKGLVNGARLISDFGDGTGADEILRVASGRIDTVVRNHTYSDIGFFHASFRLQSPQDQESLMLRADVRVEPTKNFLYHPSDAEVFATPENFTCSDFDIAPLVLMKDTVSRARAFTSVANGVYFDAANEGCPRLTAWSDPKDDVFFITVEDGTHTIDSGRLMFSEAYIPVNRPVKHPLNGFDALADWDENHDGVIDARDRVWTHLLLWKDLNHDGVGTGDELSPIATTTNILALSLASRETSDRDGNGNVYVRQGEAIVRNDAGGSKVIPIYAVRLAHEKADIHISLPQKGAASAPRR